MKGQSSIVTQSLLIVFAIVLILAVISSMNRIQEQYQDFSNNVSTKEICSLVKLSAEKIYNPISKNITMNTTEEMAYNTINLPAKMGNDYYTVKLGNGEAIIETTKVRYSCSIGINATLSGISYGGKTKISWLYGKGVNEIAIENE